MEFWVCGNPHYCNGRVTNPKGNLRCGNCGIRRNDKRIKYQIRWITVGVDGK